MLTTCMPPSKGRRRPPRWKLRRSDIAGAAGRRTEEPDVELAKPEELVEEPTAGAAVAVADPLEGINNRVRAEEDRQEAVTRTTHLKDAAHSIGVLGEEHGFVPKSQLVPGKTLFQ